MFAVASALLRERSGARREGAQSDTGGGSNARMHKEEITTIYLLVYYFLNLKPLNSRALKSRGRNSWRFKGDHLNKLLNH